MSRLQEAGWFSYKKIRQAFKGFPRDSRLFHHFRGWQQNYRLGRHRQCRERGSVYAGETSADLQEWITESLRFDQILIPNLAQHLVQYATHNNPHTRTTFVQHLTAKDAHQTQGEELVFVRICGFGVVSLSLATTSDQHLPAKSTPDPANDMRTLIRCAYVVVSIVCVRLRSCRMTAWRTWCLVRLVCDATHSTLSSVGSIHGCDLGMNGLIFSSLDSMDRCSHSHDCSFLLPAALVWDFPILKVRYDSVLSVLPSVFDDNNT